MKQPDAHISMESDISDSILKFQSSHDVVFSSDFSSHDFFKKTFDKIFIEALEGHLKV